MLIHCSSRSRIAAALCLGFFSLGAICSAETEKPASYYKNSQEGWFWYLENHPEDKTAEEPPIPDSAPLTSELPPRTAQDYSIEALWSLHPDAFKSVMDNTLKFALQSPTESNVLSYKQIESIARLRAAHFASVAAVVGLKHPEVSTLRDSPSSNPGIRARQSMESAEISSAIASARSDFALLYFTSPTCPFCREQDAILDYFIVKHGWQVKRIDPRVAPEITRQLRVSTTPTLLLVHKASKEPMPVGVGVTALPALERNIYRGIRLLRGEVGPEDLWLYDYQSGGGFDPAAIGSKDQERRISP